MFVCHFVSTSSQGSLWVHHMGILRFIVTGAFSTNKKVWTLSNSTRVLSRGTKWPVKCAFKWRRFLLLQFNDFFLPGSGLLIFRGKKSKISWDFQGQICGKFGRFCGIFAGKSQNSRKNRPISQEKSQNSQKNRPISRDFSGKKSNFEGFSGANS